MTRGSITGQVKALSMIVAIQGLIPDRRAGSAEKNPAPPPPNRRSMPPLGVAGSRGKPPAPSPTLPLTKKPRKKMGSPFPRPNPLPARRQTSLRTPALSLTPASPPSPIA
jgi:hypothetical protein